MILYSRLIFGCLSFLASSLDCKLHELGQDSRFFVVSVVPSAKWVSIHDSAGWLLSFQKQKTRGHATQAEVNAVEAWSTGCWRGCFVQFCPPPGLAGFRAETSASPSRSFLTCSLFSENSLGLTPLSQIVSSQHPSTARTESCPHGLCPHLTPTWQCLLLPNSTGAQCRQPLQGPPGGKRIHARLVGRTEHV